MGKYQSRAARLGEAMDDLSSELNEAKESFDAIEEVVDVEKTVPDELKSKVEDAMTTAQSTVEELRDELQNWFDNLHENFQNGSKGDELNEAISALDDLESSIGDIDSEDPETWEAPDADVSFPSAR